MPSRSIKPTTIGSWCVLLSTDLRTGNAANQSPSLGRLRTLSVQSFRYASTKRSTRCRDVATPSSPYSISIASFMLYSRNVWPAASSNTAKHALRRPASSSAGNSTPCVASSIRARSIGLPSMPSRYVTSVPKKSNITCRTPIPRTGIFVTENATQRAFAAPSAKQTRAAPLQIEQPAFRFDAAAETRQRPVHTDHAMARNDDRDGIGAICRTDGANRFGVVDMNCDVGVRARFTVRNRRQRVPDRALKIGTIRRQRYIEGATFPVEILFQLPFDAFERLVDALLIAFGSARFVAARKADHLECVATPGQ